MNPLALTKMFAVARIKIITIIVESLLYIIPVYARLKYYREIEPAGNSP